MSRIFDISQINQQDHWLIYLIAVIIGLALTVLLVILSYRVFYISNRRKFKRFKTDLISALSGAVNYPDKSEEYRAILKSLVKKRWHHEILLVYLTRMCYSFRGVYEQRARELYDYFELDKISQKKLKSLKWYKKTEGIIELSIMGDKDSVESILPMLEHKNWHVRKQSKIAIVELGEVEGLMQMESRMGTMSRWTFISILSILHRSAFKLSKENLETLRRSQNPSTRKLVPHLEKYATLNS